jgi:hypothetical protein
LEDLLSRLQQTEREDYTMKTRIASFVALAGLVAVLGLAQTAIPPKVMQQDKAIDFASFRTYTYEASHPAILKEVDARVLAAIEKQMAALGLTKATTGPGDIVVTYHTVTRNDVDLATFDNKAPALGAERKPAETLKIGTLVVDASVPATGKLAWRARVERAFAGDQGTQLKTVDEAVASVFTVYPTKTAKK